jgi:hypothetical protein
MNVKLTRRGNTALSLFYTLSSSPLHTHKDSQCSLVLSWQRIYNRLTVTSNHTISPLWTPYFLSCHFFSITFDCHLQFLRLLFYTLSRLVTVPFYNASARTPRKTPSSIVKYACLLIRYLAMDVLILSCEYASRECVYRAVA